jgi:hypothetical protein
VAGEREPNKCSKLLNNSKVYGVNDSIDILNEEFLNLKTYTNHLIDACFLHPEILLEDEPSQYDSFSLETHVKPKLFDAMVKAFSVSKNVTLLLPKYTNLREAAAFMLKVSKAVNRYMIKIITI